jgi:hypothetical protein
MYQYIIQISWPSTARGSFGWSIEDFVSEELLTKSQILNLIQNTRIKFEVEGGLQFVKLTGLEFPVNKKIVCETEHYKGAILIHKLD